MRLKRENPNSRRKEAMILYSEGGFQQ